MYLEMIKIILQRLSSWGKSKSCPENWCVCGVPPFVRSKWFSVRINNTKKVFSIPLNDAITIKNVWLDLSLKPSIIQFGPSKPKFSAPTCKQSSDLIARLGKIYNYHAPTLSTTSSRRVEGASWKPCMTFEGENMFKLNTPTPSFLYASEG